MNRRILVTGASGFVAEHLIKELRSRGNYVVGVDRKLAPSAFCDEYIKLDLCELADINKSNLIPKCDYVIHLAAARADWGISDDEYFRDNLEATQALLQYIDSNQIEYCMFVSSISVMPQDTLRMIDEQAPNAPINAYGKSKEAAENILIDYCKTRNNFALNILRPAVLYGPSNPKNTGLYRAIDNNIFRLIDGIFKKRFMIVGNGLTPKTTAYVKNFVAAILFSEPRMPGYDIFIYCDQPPKETRELVFLIRSYLGKKGYGPRGPIWLMASLASIFDLVGRLTGINFPITKARIQTFNRPTNFVRKKLDALGFQQIYSTEDALKETVDWYQSLDPRKLNTIFFQQKND